MRGGHASGRLRTRWSCGRGCSRRSSWGGRRPCERVLRRHDRRPRAAPDGRRVRGQLPAGGGRGTSSSRCCWRSGPWRRSRCSSGRSLSSLYDTRVPLARLFLWVQVIHAFDVPARKDLSYSLVSGLILVAVGAVLSTSLWYGLFVLAFLLCAMAAMSQMNLSEARERAGVGYSGKQGPRARHRRPMLLRRRRGRAGVLLPPAPAAGDEPDDDADFGVPGTSRPTSPAASRTRTTGRLAATPSPVRRRPSPRTLTTASSLTWTCAAAEGSPTRS